MPNRSESRAIRRHGRYYRTLIPQLTSIEEFESERRQIYLAVQRNNMGLLDVDLMFPEDLYPLVLHEKAETPIPFDRVPLAWRLRDTMTREECEALFTRYLQERFHPDITLAMPEANALYDECTTM
ncbi:MAG: hypothetical protein ACOCXQ_03035 [Patescibacteria group bacterium]